MPAAVLFDLDQTLVETSALEPLRASGSWQRVLRNLHLASPINSTIAAAQVLQALGVPVAVVTSSPRRYADELLSMNSVYPRVLVSADDVENLKPSAEPVNLALSQLGVPASKDCIFVGDSLTDIAAARSAGIQSLHFVSSEGPTQNVGSTRSNLALGRRLGLVGSSTGQQQRPVQLAEQNLNDAVLAILHRTAWYPELRSEATRRSALAWSLVGGAVRDAVAAVVGGYQYNPKDIDVMVHGAWDRVSNLTSIRRIGLTSELDSSGLDVARASFGHLMADLWCAEATHVSRLFGVGSTLQGQLPFSVFLPNGIGLDVHTERLYVVEGGVDAVQSRRMEFLAPVIYAPALQIARTMSFENRGWKVPDHVVRQLSADFLDAGHLHPDLRRFAQRVGASDSSIDLLIRPKNGDGPELEVRR